MEYFLLWLSVFLLLLMPFAQYLIFYSYAVIHFEDIFIYIITSLLSMFSGVNFITAFNIYTVFIFML